LLRTFIEKVDPFVKILHKPTLQRDFNYFCRDILPNPKEFECLLFAVYGLALLSLTSTSIEYRFHEQKHAILARYRSYVAHGLGQLNFTTSQSLSTLQILLLYMVRLSSLTQTCNLLFS
jgi:hypothetical protein